MEKHRLLYDESIIQAIVKRVAQEIDEDNPQGPIVLLGIMNGAMPFLHDLSRELVHRNIIIDTVATQSYEDQKRGFFRLTKHPSTDLANQKIIVVDDIIDSGETMKRLVRFIRGKYAYTDISICALLKRMDRENDLPNQFQEYIGTYIAKDRWVYGYGMDDNGQSRHLSHILEKL